MNYVLPKCGADNQDGIKFCKKCGASMIEGGAELATSTAKASAQEKSGSEDFIGNLLSSAAKGFGSGLTSGLR